MHRPPQTPKPELIKTAVATCVVPTYLVATYIVAIYLVALLVPSASSAFSPSTTAYQSANRPSPWSRITTEHFTVYSGGGRQAGTQLAEVMEMLHSVLEGLVGADAQSPLPTYVYLFANDDALQPFKPPMADGRTGSGRAVAGGFFAKRELANYVAINLRTSRSARDTIQHEYLHTFAQHNLPRLPLWFSEGLAEYYSTFSARDGVGYVGAPVARHVQRLSRAGHYHATRRDLEYLEQTLASKELYDDSRRASLIYAQSWALVHYLLSDDHLADQSLDFMRALAQGNQPQEAFRSSFGKPPAAFSKSLQEYLARGDFPTFHAAVKQVRTPRITPLDAAEQQAILGDLALAMNKTSLARRLFLDARDRASQLQSDAEISQVSGLANVGLARLALANLDYEEALWLARTAASQLQDSPLPFLLQGQVLQLQARLRQNHPNAIDSRTALLDKARVALRASLDRDQDFPAALVALGQSWLGDPRTAVSPESFASEGLQSFRQALDLLPKRTDIAIQLAMLQTLAARLDKAVGVLHRERPRFDTTEQWDSAWQRIGSIEIHILRNELVRESKPALEQPRLERLVSRVSRLQELTVTIEPMGVFYGDAQELERLGKIETLWTALASALQQAKDGDPPTARESIEDLLRELDWNRELEGQRVKALEREARRQLVIMSTQIGLAPPVNDK